MSTPRAGAPADRLHALLEPTVAEAGYDLESVRVSQAGKRRQVVVIVDADGGVSLDAIADVTRVVSDVLDGADGAAVLGEQPYILEVSSPGTDRPLKEPKHWRRAKARLVKVVLTAGGDVTGRVLDSDDEGVLLQVPGKKKGTFEERRLAYPEIAKARVEIEFSRKDEDTDEFDGLDDEIDVEIAGELDDIGADAVDTEDEEG